MEHELPSNAIRTVVPVAYVIRESIKQLHGILSIILAFLSLRFLYTSRKVILPKLERYCAAREREKEGERGGNPSTSRYFMLYTNGRVPKLRSVKPNRAPPHDITHSNQIEINPANTSKFIIGV